MRRHNNSRHNLANFKISLVTAAIVISVSACSGAGTGTDTPATVILGAANPAEQRVFYALPGMQFSHFEETDQGLSFVSDSTPGFSAAADTPNRIEVDWQDSPEAVQYQVYRRDTETQLLSDQLCNDEQFGDLGTFSEVATLTESFYVDEGTSGTVRYEYRVLAIDVDQVRKTIASGLVVSVDEAVNALASLRQPAQAPTVVTIPTPEPEPAGQELVPTSNTDSSETVNPPTDPVTGTDNFGTDKEEAVVEPPAEEVTSPFAPVPTPPTTEPAPTDPVDPVTPDTPDVPDTPDTPDTPDVPDTPDTSPQEEITDETPDTEAPEENTGCGPDGTDTPGSSEEQALGESGPVIVAEEASLSPSLIFPDVSQALSGSSMDFMWQLNDTEVTQWWLRAGPAEDTASYYDSGRITNASTRSKTVTGLPTDGSKVHVQLAYKKTDGQWGKLRYVFDSAVIAQAAPVPPQLGAASGNGDWDNTMRPPTLVNPIEIVMDSNYPTIAIPDFDRVGCEGLIHRINVPYDEDVLITMAPGSEPLKYPVFVYGGRNLHMRGLEMRTIVQDGCDVGEAHQIRNTIPNIHPRLPGGKVFRLEQSGTTYVEGVDIDLKGQEADCFVIRNPSSMTLEQALDKRHIYFVNTRCTGIEGLDDSPIGDGIHGDFFQNQGKDSIASFNVENVSFRTSSNGITLHAWNGRAGIPHVFRLRNMDYGWDLRYDDDDAYEISGLAYSAHGREVIFENVFLNHPRNGNYGFINGERLGAINHGGGYIRKVDGVYEGTPPGGDFATEDETGLEYQSPF